MEFIIRTEIIKVLQEIPKIKPFSNSQGSTLGISGTNFTVEHNSNFAYGDYTSNVAMMGSKDFGKSPRELAELIKEKLDEKILLAPQKGLTLGAIEKIEIAGPGFINFYLARSFFKNQIIEINKSGDHWGKNKNIPEGQLVLLEYTSPNLFKPLHVGNLVGNIIGESIARLFEYSGVEIKRINYPSDIGLTVAKGVWGLMKTGGDADDIKSLGEAYRIGNDAYENEENLKKEIENINKALCLGNDSKLNEIRKHGIKTSYEHIEKICHMLGTTFDGEIFESETGPIGRKIVEANLSNGIFEKSMGAIIFPGEKYGLHTRVFITSQGLTTYEAKDLGNFSLKNKKYPNWTQSIIVTGAEQREYFKVVIEAIRAVFNFAKNKTIEHILTGFLTLTTGKMSSRKGNVLTGESLLFEIKEEALGRVKKINPENANELAQDIAVGALKYQILRQAVGSNIVFDKKQALSFEGDSGPYLQYTHARIVSVLNKAQSVNIEPSATNVPEVPYEIEKFLYQFPEVVERALKERSPHYIVIFLTKLAGLFNTFYANERIADTTDVYAPYKIFLVMAIQQTLKNGLYLLGIQAPNKM
jgi:arginyl-tRNA synthetase